MSKRNKKTGRFEHQYKKSSDIVNHIVPYLLKLNWWARLNFVFSPCGFTVQYIDMGLWKYLKQLEDKEEL